MNLASVIFRRPQYIVYIYIYIAKFRQVNFSRNKSFVRVMWTCSSRIQIIYYLCAVYKLMLLLIKEKFFVWSRKSKFKFPLIFTDGKYLYWHRLFGTFETNLITSISLATFIYITNFFSYCEKRVVKENCLFVLFIFMSNLELSFVFSAKPIMTLSIIKC